MDRSNKNIGEDAAHFAVANKSADDMKSYISRGRTLSSLSIEELEALYKESLRIFCDKIETPFRETLQDTFAEYEIRGIVPASDDETEMYLKILEEKALKALEADPDTKERIGAEIISEYLESASHQKPN